MIVDQITNAGKYKGISAGIDTALDYLEKAAYAGVEPGKYEIPGTDCAAVILRYDSRLLENGKWEAHEKMIDVQFVADGVERICYAEIGNLKKTAPYDAEKDFQALEGPGDWITMEKGMFMLLFPHDAHLPCVSIDEKPGPVHKVVVKVPA